MQLNSIYQLLPKIEQHVKKITFHISPVHGFCHLKRTAQGAQWFAQQFNASEYEQTIAYLAGLIHDLERPNSEKIDHTDISLNQAKKLMDNFQVDQTTQQRVLTLIGKHRHFEETPLEDQWVFLADKILEQSGAYVVFRRFYYIGECDDFQDQDFITAGTAHWQYRLNKFSPEKYHPSVRRLATNQYQWQLDFFQAFKNKEDWTMGLGKTFFDYGRQQEPNLDSLIESYQPKNKLQQEYKDEAIAYLQGSKKAAFAQDLEQLTQ